MDYKIIIYKLIIFKIKQNQRIITKKYFQRIKTINNIDIKDLSYKMIEYKKIYKDNCYIFNMLKENEEDIYFNNLNEKSKKYYCEYMGQLLD
jgi:hypothetical protein